jgi:hypothetical protein
MKKEPSLSKRRQSHKQDLFLDHFKQTGNLSQSADVAGVSRQLVYYWRQTSRTFANRMLDAENESRDHEGNYILNYFSTKAQAGNRECQEIIRKLHGAKTLKAVMRGGILTLNGLRA